MRPTIVALTVATLVWFCWADPAKQPPPDLGFIGTRGKRSAASEESDLYDERVWSNEPSPMTSELKRAPQGASDYGEDNYVGYYKRAPSAHYGSLGERRAPIVGFFGTRGKKLHRPGFFGTRGKKYQYKLPTQFVGVRGKKSAEGGYGARDELLERLAEILILEGLYKEE